MDEQTIRTLAGVAFLGALAFFFRGLLQEGGKDSYSWMRDRFFAKQTNKAAEVGVRGDHDAIPSAQIPQPTPHLPGLTWEQIREAIDGAPPLQRDDIANRYIGLRVDWPVYLFDARRVGEAITVELSIVRGNFPKAVCTVAAVDYPQLGILAEGAPMRVAGVISKSGYRVELSDARLTFPQ